MSEPSTKRIKSRPTWPLAAALTAVAFLALHWAGHLGTLPLPELVGILAACVAVSQIAPWRYRHRLGGAWVIAVGYVVPVTVVIYAIGWGPTLALGYLFPLAELFRTKGPKGWYAVFIASAVGIAGGEVFIAFGLVHSYVPTPYVHGLAALAVLGLAFVMQLFASTATAREQADREARRSEQRFRSLVQNAVDAVMIVGVDGAHVYDSPGVERVLGYRPEEIRGVRLDTHLHPDDRPTIAEVARKLGEAPNEPCTVELRARHADGSWRWCELAIRNLINDPAVGGVVINLADVTERHKRLELQGQLASIIDSSGEAIIGLGIDGTILSWNRAAEAMYGYSAEEVVGTNAVLGSSGKPDPLLQQVVQRVGQGESIRSLDMRRRRRDGTDFDLSVTAAPIRDVSDNVIGASVVARDVTEQKHAAQALKNSEENFRQLFAANPQPMWVYDIETLEFLEVNDAAIHHYGYSREQFLSMKITDIRPQGEVKSLLEDVALPRKEFEKSTAWHHRLADGSLIDVEISSHRLAFGGRDAILVGARDVTEQNALERRLRHQAFHDELTGVANRTLLRERASQALARAKRTGRSVALVVVDLDDFHQINDVFGPELGDTVLQNVASALEEVIRPTDTLARIGSDEFALLLADVEDPIATTTKVADRILERLALPMSFGDNSITIEVTVGAAVATETTTDIVELVQRAEAALAKAKQSLTRREIDDPSDVRSTEQRFAVIAELRQAIEGGQLILHYQPVMNLSDEKMTGLEALVRWQHPERGLVPPNDFVPLAERTGLIRGLTSFVLQTAIAQLALWRELDPEFCMSVNLGTANLTDPDLPREIARLLFKCKVPAKALTLEITESGVLFEPHRTANVVSDLSALGVSLSVDDFGTGHSSLSKLRALPITEIKLDKSFVINMLDEPSDATIVRSSIELAHNLGLSVVAEGIETLPIREKLRRLGCDFGQGFWFCRPLPAQEMTSWLSHQHHGAEIG